MNNKKTWQHLAHEEKNKKKKPLYELTMRKKINWLTTIKMQLILHSFKIMNSENFQEARMEIKTYFKGGYFDITAQTHTQLWPTS